MRKKKLIKNTIYHVLVTIFGLIMVYPLVWMFMSSFKDTNTIFTTATQLIPETFTLDNYINGWKGFGGISFGKFFGNSLFISLVATIGTVFSSAVVAYGLKRCHFKGKKILTVAMLLSMMLPAQVLMIPQYLWYQKLGWVGTYLPLIVPYCFAIQGFFVYLMMNFIGGIPKELDEAAKIDGCGHVSAFTKIMLPIAKPGIVVAAVFSFGYAWGDLIYGITFITNPNMRPITSSIYNYVQQYQTLWNSTMAFGIIAITPVVLIFIFMQKYIVSGLTNGAVKA